jgi:hypothetical protein
LIGHHTEEPFATSSSVDCLPINYNSMNHRGYILVCASLCGFCRLALSQDFVIFDRTVQVHGFASQGFVYTDDNNWLTMNTASGSAAFTEFALNASTELTDRLRAGAQVYDRNLGKLGQYHPSLDWASLDYRLRNWVGIRAGKVKTPIGLFNDTQDLDFLQPFALLPQSVYPTDLRDATIAHLGGDVYGDAVLPHGFGDLSYTAYAGHRSDSIYSGYPYLLSQFGTYFTSFGGLQYGGDLRWKPPIPGLLIGVSRLDEDLSGKGTALIPGTVGGPRIPYSEWSKADGLNQFYGEYVRGKLRADSEYRRYIRDQALFSGTASNLDDVRGWYFSAAYRISRKIELASYYSRYSITAVFGGALVAAGIPNQTDTSLPANHIYDKVISASFNPNRFLNFQIEAHFMAGYGDSTYPDGFYPQVNPKGFQPDTNALVAKTSFHF